MRQIIEAYGVVAQLMGEFFKVSDIEKNNTPKPTNKGKEKSGKN
jgi:hypothetical protein